MLGEDGFGVQPKHQLGWQQRCSERAPNGLLALCRAVLCCRWQDLTTTLDGPEVCIFKEACRKNKVYGIFSIT
jgi:hypothetical protein